MNILEAIIIGVILFGLVTVLKLEKKVEKLEKQYEILNRLIGNKDDQEERSEKENI
jgi:hypothetical protein